MCLSKIVTLRYSWLYDSSTISLTLRKEVEILHFETSVFFGWCSTLMESLSNLILTSAYVSRFFLKNLLIICFTKELVWIEGAHWLNHQLICKKILMSRKKRLSGCKSALSSACQKVLRLLEHLGVVALLHLHWTFNKVALRRVVNHEYLGSQYLLRVGWSSHSASSTNSGTPFHCGSSLRSGLLDLFELFFWLLVEIFWRREGRLKFRNLKFGNDVLSFHELFACVWFLFAKSTFFKVISASLEESRSWFIFWSFSLH